MSNSPAKDMYLTRNLSIQNHVKRGWKWGPDDYDVNVFDWPVISIQRLNYCKVRPKKLWNKKSLIHYKQSNGQELKNKKIWVLIQVNYQYGGNILGPVNMKGLENQVNVRLLLETQR